MSPRPSTILILANALGLSRGSPEYEAFFSAASRQEESTATRPAPSGPWKANHQSLPLVTAGREEEVGRLERHLHAALDGSPQIVFLAGDSGIGKSFLVRHFGLRAISAHPHLVVLTGTANSPTGLGEPYHVFRQILALLAGDISSARDDQLLSSDHAQRLQQLSLPTIDVLMAHGPALIGPFVDTGALQRRVRPLAPSDAGWLPELDRLATTAVGGDTINPDQMHEQIARVLIETAKIRPLVLFLDDLHWADDRTCDLLFYLARHLYGVTGVRLLMVGAYRPADLAVRGPNARHPLFRVINETGRYWGRILIDLTNTVGNENGQSFIDAMLDAEPNHLEDDFRSLLFERTEGHPLFVTELLRWLRDHGILVQDEDGAWIADRQISFDKLPPRISAVVAERLDRLPIDLQKTLRAGSVQGLTFAADIVATVRRISHRRLAGHLESLIVDHRLLIPESTAGSGADSHRYRFSHSLFQEYLEGSLSPYTRQVLHIETAEAFLTARADPTDAALDIARHFELGGDDRRACDWYLQAATRDLREFDHDTALRWFSHALDLANGLDEHALVSRAAIGVAEALRARGDLPAAIQVGSSALAASDFTQDSRLRAECLTSLGVYFYDIGNHDQAESYLVEALDLLEGSTGSAGGTACTANYLLSYTLYARGDYSAALEHANRALALARASKLKREEGESLVSVAFYYVDLGDYAAALGFYDSALKCQRAARDYRGEAVSLLNIGLCRIELGQLDEALSPLEQALQFGERVRVPRTQAFALNYLGLLHEARKQWTLAKASYAAAYQRRLSIGQESLAIDPLAGTVRVAVATGDLDTVRKGADEILDWLAIHGSDGIEYPVRVYLTLVEALRAVGKEDRAATVLAEGRDLLSKRAARIVDPVLRRSFLERVPFNHMLMTLNSSAGGVSATQAGQSLR